ncbi:type II toxin-antitoxin system HipA family toxin [Pseudidiomarina homiensis]|nr:HipA domain-containing protein [Pseudidiomarina homiensis]
MMTSSLKDYSEAYVWVWLPESAAPIVAGKLEAYGQQLRFNYGQSYLDRAEQQYAIPLYLPELPLRKGRLENLPGLSMPNCLRDAAPDAWGRRVILNKLVGRGSQSSDTAELGELVYLLESGSDRIGAFDFQLSPTEYVPRSAKNVPLEELVKSAERVEQGIPLTPELDQALFHGSSIGGARPKALIEANTCKYIAKFSSSTDTYSVVKAEYIAMRLADEVGLDVAPVKLVKAANKDVLLIERFDRQQHPDGWRRKIMVSALTLLELDDMMARYASYETLAEIIRHRFIEPKATLHELFQRLVFNILVGNTDDHARNHAAFWDGKDLTLTPAYDICPQGRAGNEQSQAMLIHGRDNRSSLSTCLKSAASYLLTEAEAKAIMKQQIATIEQRWVAICDEAEFNQVERKLLWRRQFLNPYSVDVP